MSIATGNQPLRHAERAAGRCREPKGSVSLLRLGQSERRRTIPNQKAPVLPSPLTPAASQRQIAPQDRRRDALHGMDRFRSSSVAVSFARVR
jgi:hypothetical protein